MTAVNSPLYKSPFGRKSSKFYNRLHKHLYALVSTSALGHTTAPPPRCSVSPGLDMEPAPPPRCSVSLGWTWDLLLTLWWFLFSIKLLINSFLSLFKLFFFILFDALRYAHVLHGNELRQLGQVKDVSNFLTEFRTDKWSCNSQKCADKPRGVHND